MALVAIALFFGLFAAISAGITWVVQWLVEGMFHYHLPFGYTWVAVFLLCWLTGFFKIEFKTTRSRW